MALGGCAPAPEEPAPAPAPAPEPETGPILDSGLPPNALPDVPRAAGEPCPYLDDQFVAGANGQKVMAWGVDKRFDTPACVYWSYGDEPQLQVIVRATASEADARAVVDWAAPVDSTDPASLPGGWEGGRSGGDGAVFAVAKGTDAVAVFSDQSESVKAQAVAEQVISALNL